MATTFKSVKAALSTPTFIVQSLITVIVNLTVNLGLPYGTYSNWGARRNPEQFPALSMWAWNYEVGSCLALDIFLTHFLLATFSTWASTGGAQKDVRERKCKALEPAALAQRPWVFTPVNVRSLFWRGLAMGCYVTILLGGPVLLLTWAAVGNGTWSGYSYVITKGIYAGIFLAFGVYVLVYLAAIDRRNFVEFDYASLASSPALGADASGVAFDGGDRATDGYYGVTTPVKAVIG